MKHLKSRVLVFVITMAASACGGQPLPTMDPADVQLTTVAGVLTGLAQTQSAVPTATVPTATPLPPTETPSLTSLPASASQTPVLLTTLTSLPTLPTLQATSTSAPVSTSGPDPCLSTKKGIPYPPAGRPTIIRIINSNQTTVNVTLYLNKTPHGECGYRAYIINSLSEITITNLVQGCYHLWAWSNDPSRPVNAASKLSCINSPDKWTFRITADKIKFLDL